MRRLICTFVVRIRQKQVSHDKAHFITGWLVYLQNCLSWILRKIMALMEKQLFISFVKGRIESQHDKTNKMTCTPNEDSDQAGLDIHPVWSESLQCTLWVAKDLNILHADREDSYQTGQMPRLIRVFAGCTSHFVCFFMLQLSLSCLLSTPLLVKKQTHCFTGPI